MAKKEANSTSTDPARYILDHSAVPTFSFAFAEFLKQEYRFGLDPNRPRCRAFLQGHCPLGNSCPDQHVASTPFNDLVCKHWLRGLCKKGDACEFLHEYNLRRMPECIAFNRNRYCMNGEECLYIHVDSDARLPPCPHYDKGFCPLGPRCSKKHIRKSMCPYYLAGFCPDGRNCKEGAHPKWPTTDLPPPTIKIKKDPAEIERDIMAAMAQDQAERGEDGDRSRDRDRDRDRGYGQRREWGGRGWGRPYRNRRQFDR